MILYHGSNIANIKVLESRIADQDSPYIYLTSSNKSPASNAKSRKRWWGLPKEIFISLCQHKVQAP